MQVKYIQGMNSAKRLEGEKGELEEMLREANEKIKKLEKVEERFFEMREKDMQMITQHSVHAVEKLKQERAGIVKELREEERRNSFLATRV